MLQARLEEGKKHLPKEKHKFLSPNKLVPRHEELRKLEGWRTVSLTEVSVIYNFIKDIEINNYIKNGYLTVDECTGVTFKIKALLLEWDSITVNKQRFSKFLKRKLLIPEGFDFEFNFDRFFSDLGKQPREFSFKLSCSFNDLLRVQSPHYKSCYIKDAANLGCNYHAPFNFCFDCTVGVIYIPDKHGDYFLRAYVHICKNKEGETVLYVVGCYGVTSHIKQILETLRKEIKVYVSANVAEMISSFDRSSFAYKWNEEFAEYLFPLVRSKKSKIDRYYEDNMINPARGYKTFSLETLDKHF